MENTSKHIPILFRGGWALVILCTVLLCPFIVCGIVAIVIRNCSIETIYIPFLVLVSIIGFAFYWRWAHWIKLNDDTIIYHGAWRGEKTLAIRDVARTKMVMRDRGGCLLCLLNSKGKELAAINVNIFKKKDITLLLKVIEKGAADISMDVFTSDARTGSYKKIDWKAIKPMLKFGLIWILVFGIIGGLIRILRNLW